MSIPTQSTDSLSYITSSDTIASASQLHSVIRESSLWDQLSSEWNLSFCDHISRLQFPALVSLLACIVIVLLVSAFLMSKPGRWPKLPLRLLFCLSWAFTFVVYDIGMCTGQWISLLTNAPMAVLHAFGAFILDSDVSAIHEPFHNSWVFMAAFSLSHVFAAIVSTVFILRLFGFNLKARWRIFWERIFRKNKRHHTYVFWGYNRQTFRLIKSIIDHYKSHNTDGKSYRIVVVQTNAEADEQSDTTTGFNRIFEFLSLRTNELDQLEELSSNENVFTCATYADLNSLQTDSNSQNRREIIRSDLKLKSLQKLLTASKTTGHIYMLFLSDDEKQNLHDASVLLDDATIQAFGSSTEERHVTFYCHARYNSVHRVMEDRHLSNELEVKIIDSSHICVELIKRDGTLIPARYVDVNEDGTVASEFNALIVGFSEVGSDAARFIYEYGAFVAPGKDIIKAVRSPFHLDVVDKDMSDLAGAFVANAPAIKPFMPFLDKYEQGDSKSLIALHEMDCRGVEFYKMIKRKINQLNYIVVATDDDELNISTAIRIFKLATRYRGRYDEKNSSTADRNCHNENALKDFCILVRIHRDEDEHFAKIADYYNRMWKSQIEAYRYARKYNKEHAEEIAKKKDVYEWDTTQTYEYPLNGYGLSYADDYLPPIHIFGLDHDVYTYANIFDDTLKKEAQEYKKKYEMSASGLSEEDAKKVWQKNVEYLLQLKAPFVTYAPTYSGVLKLRRQQQQDFANSLHAETKKYLYQCALAKAHLSDFSKQLRRLSKTMAYTTHSGEPADDYQTILLTRLAQTEHLRWNASHEILGYEPSKAPKDEMRFLHNCLIDWEKLSDETRSYDFNVVDVTLGITIQQPPKTEKA